MQTKRKQTLLAGVGLLTALSLSMVGCTPSKFTPGPGAPTAPSAPGAQTPSTPTAQPLTFKGLVEVDGKPLSGAALQLVNVSTGQVIATGGGNLKTDANGAFSFDVAGLTTDDVVSVEAVADGKNLSALVSGDGETTFEADAAGYAVAQARTLNVRINPATTYQSHVMKPILKLLAKETRDAGVSRRRVLKDAQKTYKQINRHLAENPDDQNALLTAAPKNALFTDIAKRAGVIQLINQTLQTVAQQVAKTNPEALQTADEDTFVGVDIQIKIEGNKITIGDTVIDTSTGTVDVPEPVEPAPILTPEEQKQEADENLGVWINSGNMNPVVTIGTNTVQVSQGKGQAQIQNMELRLPTANLTGFTDVAAFKAGLGGNVTGTTQAGVARTGVLTFTGDDKVNLGTFGQIGTYTVTLEGQTLVIKMTYTFSESAVTIVGAHTTAVTHSTVTLTKNDGLSIQLSGEGASARIQY